MKTLEDSEGKGLWINITGGPGFGRHPQVLSTSLYTAVDYVGASLKVLAGREDPQIHVGNSLITNLRFDCEALRDLTL